MSSSEEYETDSDSEEEGVYVPQDVIYEIYTFLTFRDVCNGLFVCKDFNRALSRDYLWFKMAYYRWTFVKLRPPIKTWREYFIRYHTVGKRWERGRPNIDYKVKTLRGDKTRFSKHIDQCFIYGRFILLKDDDDSIKLWKEHETDFDFECLVEDDSFHVMHQEEPEESFRVHVSQDLNRRAQSENFRYLVSFYRPKDAESDSYFLDDDYFEKKNIVEVRDGQGKAVARVKTDAEITGISYYSPVLAIARFPDNIHIYHVDEQNEGKETRRLHILNTAVQGTTNTNTRVDIRLYRSSIKGEYIMVCHNFMSANRELRVYKFSATDRKKKVKELRNVVNVERFELSRYYGLLFCVANNQSQIDVYSIENTAGDMGRGRRPRGRGQPGHRYSLQVRGTLTCMAVQGRRKLAVGTREGSVMCFSCTLNEGKELWRKDQAHREAINDIQVDQIKCCAASADNSISVHDVKDNGNKLYNLLGGSRRLRRNEITHPSIQWIYKIRSSRSSVVACLKNLIRVYSFE